MCHRNFPPARTDTNMFVEAFHNRLKTYFMKPNRRVDDLINLLLVIEEEDYWRRKSDLQYKSVAPRPAASKESRHKNGLKIEDSHVEMLDANTWRVKSQSQTDVWHSVSALEKRCDQDHCFEKCQELACLGLCSHLYHCNCDDNALLCKHTHKIHAFQVRMHHIARTEVEEADTADHFQGYSHELPLTTTDIPNEEDQPKPAPPERLLEATKLDVSKLEDMLQNEVVVRALLPQINGTLKRLLAQCTAVISSNDRLTQEPQLMHAAKMIQPNEKLQLQLRPMTKAPKRKVAAPIFTGPTSSQKKELLNSFSQTCQRKARTISQ